ncbi:MAG TPA: AMP phosphorylase [Candidatus Nanoarchaeia archaeon]|nr:AMP phosphorylase [Candidatus Nanoarchaeia archaeon]
MKLKVKDVDIRTGGPLICILSEIDADKMDLHNGDRVKITSKGKIETVLINIGESKKAVCPGHIGLYEEVLDSLGVVHNDNVEMIPARKPLSLDFIKRKLDGYKLSKEQIGQIVWDVVNNKLTGVELTYFVAACYLNELDVHETVFLTKAMASHGNILRLNRSVIADKHCIGGVAGNRTTMVIVPILAAAGVTIPKTSSRSITSPAGTADTMEVLANVCIPLERMKKVVQKTNGCIVWGGALNLAPADDKIIRVERPLLIDAKSQLLASVMAKKASVSASHLLIDIPTGKGSKLPDVRKARQLKQDFICLAGKLGIKSHVIITDGKEPVGNGIGPALEARDVLWTLEGDGPLDLRKKCLMMAGILLEMAGKAKKGEGQWLAQEILESGKALEKMKEIIEMQGKIATEPSQIKLGKIRLDVAAKTKGVVSEISNRAISKIARVAGAPECKGAGIYLHKHVGDKVKKGENIYTVFCHDKGKLDFVKYAVENLDGFLIS